MNVPGANLLKLALGVIKGQTVRYYRYTSKVTNAAGKDVPGFADPVDVVGSWQPVDPKSYQAYGLDFDKSYATFYAPGQDVQDVGRDRTSDEMGFGGRRWKVQGKTPWFAQDGWDSVLVVDVGADA